MTRSFMFRFSAALGSFAPGFVWAHDLSDRYGPFFGAAIHPLTELDHVFPFIAIGLLAGHQGMPVVWRVLAAFLAALLFGVIAPAFTVIPDDIAKFLGIANLASFFVLGAFVAAALRMPARVVIILAAIFGLSHGLENGLDLEDEVSFLSVSGVLLAGALAAVLPAIIAAKFRAGWRAIAVRVAGSWIAAIGLIVLGLRFRA